MAPKKKSGSLNKIPLDTDDPSAEENYRSSQRSKNRGGSDSERENYGASGFPQFPETTQVKVQSSVSNEDHNTHSVAAIGGCLSSLRSLYYGNQLRAVGKRTPRFPISYLEEMDKGKNHASGNKCSQKSEFDVSSDEVGATSMFAEASQRRGSSSTSVPCKIKGKMKSSYEVSRRHKGRPEKKYGHDLNSSVDIECLRTDKAHHKMKKLYRNENILDDQNRRFHQSFNYTENRLEASNMDELSSLSVLKGKVDSKISNAVCEPPSPLIQRKKRRKLSRGDENTAFDAFQTLVDLTSMMPFTATESEPSVRIGEETESFNLEDKSYIPEVTLSARSDKGEQIVVNAMHNSEDRGHGKSKPGSGLSIDVVSKRRKRLEHSGTTRKGKHKFVIPDTKDPLDAHLHEDLKIATSEHIKPLNNENQATLPIKLGSRSRRKMELRKLLTRQKMEYCDIKLEKELTKYSSTVQGRGFLLKDKLSNCMSSPMVRRWCIFEWFYSAIDYPWFARREFVEYLKHVGLENIPRLTRVEWSIIKSSLGRPRRFSENFLLEERMKLQRYRESARQYYAELRAGTCEGLPIDLARPLSVGQRVIALHPYPNTLEVHDGRVLTVQHDNCMIQFDNQEIGVKLVMDFDCKPFTPMDNFPEAIRRQCYSINRAPLEYKGLQQNSRRNVSRKLEKRSSPHTTDTLVPSNMFNMKQQNTFSGNSLPLRLMPLANTGALSGIPCSLNVSQGCGAVDILKGSREKAQLMVNVAIEVLLSKNDGDDPLKIILGALHSSFEVQKPLNMSHDMKEDSLGAHFNQFYPSKHLFTGDLSDLRSRHSDKDYGGIPSNLITSCVATLLMIQACIERPYPPGDVAQILGLAIKSLHPKCSENLHFYQEIENCMGRIKTQLLSIVPT